MFIQRFTYNGTKSSPCNKASDGGDGDEGNQGGHGKDPILMQHVFQDYFDAEESTVLPVAERHV